MVVVNPTFGPPIFVLVFVSFRNAAFCPRSWNLRIKIMDLNRLAANPVKSGKDCVRVGARADTEKSFM